MLKKDNRQKVLKVFYEDPLPMGGGLQLREIGRKIDLAPLSVKRYLNELLKERLIIEEKHRIHNYPVYYANRDNEYFRTLKRLDTVLSIEECGLLEHLYKRCMPDAIILFGSASLGEDVKGSDIDIFLICNETELNLEKYERILSRKIQVHFSDNLKGISKELRNNILNGMVLKGYIKVY